MIVSFAVCPLFGVVSCTPGFCLFSLVRLINHEYLMIFSHFNKAMAHDHMKMLMIWKQLAGMWFGLIRAVVYYYFSKIATPVVLSYQSIYPTNFFYLWLCTFFPCC